MSLRRLLPISLLSLLALGADARAQDAETPAKAVTIGEYGGVRAGESSVAPRGARPGRRAIYWLGFQALEDGSSRIFAQLGREVEFEQWTEGERLIVHLSKTRIGSRAVARFLDTRFFDTSIRMIRARRVPRRRAKGERPAHDRGVQIVVDFKNPADLAEASASMTREADGFTYLYLDFAAGTEAASE